jgi:hypothetical protein
MKTSHLTRQNILKFKQNKLDVGLKQTSKGKFFAHSSNKFNYIHNPVSANSIQYKGILIKSYTKAQLAHDKPFPVLLDLSSSLKIKKNLTNAS